MMVVVVLSDCPAKLRGDMTKWFVEISTGVYVGNINVRVRDQLWDRICGNVGRGHATMVYAVNNEQHMDFRVHNAYWQPVDYDGIHLMRRPSTEFQKGKQEQVFSPRIAQLKRSKHRGIEKNDAELMSFLVNDYVVLDFETTGLDEQNDEITEIGAVLVERNKITESLQILVQCNKHVPCDIVALTGITDEMLKTSGVTPRLALQLLAEFAEDLPIVCHNAKFEQGFWQNACKREGLDQMENRFIDTLQMSKILLPNNAEHKLSALASYFAIPVLEQHRALPDSKTTYSVYSKLKGLATAEIQK